MKLRIYIYLLFLTGLSYTSCRTEETEIIQAPEDETLVANSSIALLMQRTASNDGSKDNIVDKANCFDINFPYTVNANGQDVILYSTEDYAIIECVLDQSDADIDSVNIIFPISITKADFSETTITNTAELNSYANTCNGENVVDDDIECLDFQYPITASIFNSNNELLDTTNIDSDFQLYQFIADLDQNDIVTIDFPFSVVLSNDSEILINNLNELEFTIENAENMCDEDDDYDYNDDDCDDCTPVEIANLLTSCSNWEVNRLKRNNTDYDNVYDGYVHYLFIGVVLQ